MTTARTRASAVKVSSALAAFTLAAFLQLSATAALPQTWDYKVATEGGGTPGYITLDQKDGKSIVRIEPLGFFGPF